MAVCGGLTNSCEKNRSEKQRRKGKILPFECRVQIQRIARRDKKAVLSYQCKDTEENNRMGKTRDLFKKTRDTKGTVHAKMINLDSILRNRDIILPIKVSLVKAIVFPVVMYGCESWTVKKAEGWKTDAFELWCRRRLLRVPWTARRSNQSILKEINVHRMSWCWR